MHARGNVHETAMNDPNKQPGMEMVRLFWIPPTLGGVEMNQLRGQLQLGSFKVPLAPADLETLPPPRPVRPSNPLYGMWNIGSFGRKSSSVAGVPQHRITSPSASRVTPHREDPLQCATTPSRHLKSLPWLGQVSWFGHRKP